MKLENLKRDIELKQYSETTLLIFKISENDFIPKQYINEIANILNKDIIYYHSAEELVSSLGSIFVYNNSLNVFVCDVFDYDNPDIMNYKNVFIITKKIKSKLYTDNVIEIPKLEDWQYKDYIKSYIKNISDKDVDYLFNICNKNIYRLSNEISKLSIFDNSTIMLKDFIADGVFSDLSNKTIFDFTNALFHRDLAKLKSVELELCNIDIDGVGLLVTLYNNVKNAILIQLNPTATADSCNLKPNQFWAIKNNNCNIYSKEQLLTLFDELTALDSKFKAGIVPAELLIDYITILFFTV